MLDESAPIIFFLTKIKSLFGIETIGLFDVDTIIISQVESIMKFDKHFARLRHP